MYAIELDDGRYLSGFNYGMPDGVYDKFSALKFNSEFEAKHLHKQMGCIRDIRLLAATRNGCV